MTTITGNSTQPRARDGAASIDFDSLIERRPGVAPARAETPEPRALEPRTLEELLVAEPSAPRASLPTVASIFFVIALAQVGVLAIAVLNYDISVVRLLLGYVVAMPAVLYGFVAAWDHRQLRASGDDTAPWEWALLFPPAYLALRWARARRSRGSAGAVLGWGIAQFVVTCAFDAIAAAAVVVAPVSAAEATPVVPLGGVTGDYVVQVVESGWTDAGITGSASCPDPAAQTPGTTIDCTGVIDGEPLAFTAELGDYATGGDAVTITRWTTSTAG